jgi:hypothetical protein
VTFTVATSAGSDPRFYQWRYFGSPLPGATNTSFVINDAQVATNGNYSVTVSNFISSVTSTDAVLTVVDTLPLLLVQPKSQTNGAGSNLVFTVTTLGTDPRTYQWQYENVDIPGATDSSLSLTNIQTNSTIFNAGNYSVTVSNDLGVATSTNALLTVTNRAPIVTSHPAGVTTNVGGSATFGVSANGQAPLSYQWLHDGNLVGGATTVALTRNNVQVSDAGFYSVVVTSGAYSATSQVAQLAVTIASTPGNGTGLRGDYYTTQFQTFTNAPTLTRLDTNVDFVFGTGSPDPLISSDKFTVRWTGQVQPLYSQAYTFYTKSDDGARLWVNGQLMVDRWVNQSVTEIASSPVSLTANQKYHLLMEYYENTSSSEVHLIWSSPSQVKQAVATSQLYPASLAGPVVPVLSVGLDGANQVFNWSGAFTLQPPSRSTVPLPISPV